ncbi:MAG: hypothetical protein HY671_00125 [Chloroflexi bacterium]|nr:hypothetical protein [Chloroflexota bacterium]
MNGALGNGSCMACHLAEFPAQNSKDRWEALPDVLKWLRDRTPRRDDWLRHYLRL